MSPPTVTLPPLMLTPPLCPLAFFSSLISASFLIALPIYAPSQTKTRRLSHLPPATFRRVPAAFYSSPPLSQLCLCICGIGAFDLLKNLQGSLSERYGLGAFAELVMGLAHVPERVRFAVAVADLARDLQVLFVVLNGAAVLAQSVIAKAQVAQHVAFAAPVPDLSRDLQVLFVVLDGPAGLAQSVVGNAQVAQVPAFRRAVLQPPGSGEGRFPPADLLTRMQAQLETIPACVRVGATQKCRSVG